MSYSSFLVQIPGGLPLKSINGRYGRATTRKVTVCSCPWSGSESELESETEKKLTSQNSITNTNNYPLPDHGQQRLPPGPSLLHLVGLLHYPMRSLPYHYALRDLAKTYGPLLHLQVGELPMILVSSPRIAKEVLKTHDVACADRPEMMTTRVISYDYKDIVTPPYGKHWKQMRHICIAELLSAKNVRSFEYIRKDQGRILVDDIMLASRGGPTGGPLDLTEKIIWFMNSMTCRAVFGKVSMDRAKTIKLIRAGIAVVGNLDIGDLFPSIKLLKHISWNSLHLKRIMPELDKILDGVIDEHRKNLAVNGELGTEDFVDVMLRLKETDHLQFPITNDIIKAVICDMLAGGTETVSSVVNWTMAELMKNPRVMAKAQAEIRQALGGRKTVEESEIRKLSYLKLVVKETMRLHPPNGVLLRSCRGDNHVEIDGYHIPQNSIIAVNLWWLGRDPMNWQEPERFQPERFEGSSVDFLGNHFQYIPFGSGKRICPGIAFGVASIEFVLAHLLYYYDWKLPPGTNPEDLDMTEANGFAAFRKGSLNLIATAYAPAFTRGG